MVLLFLRELLEQLSLSEQPQQSYGCPMTKCHRTFVAPLQVIQHLLSCPELATGEFNCDKCSTSHSFPTNEKDWAQWMGWRFPHPVHGGHIQRKRSLGSKMKDFALRKKDPSRKQNPVFDPHFRSSSMADTRPSTAASEAPSTTFTSRPFQHQVVFPGQPGQDEPGPGFQDLQKQPVLHQGLPEVDGSMFWPGFNAGASDLPSTVSSIALSSTVDENNPSDRLSQNTSQTTLFTNTGLASYQQPPGPSAPDPNNVSSAPQFIYPTQLPFNNGLTSLPGHPPPPASMCLDGPVPLAQSPLSPTELRSAASAGHGWWGPKVEVETPRPTPPSSGPDSCFPLQANMLGDLARGVGAASLISSPTSPCTTASPFYRAQPTTAHTMSRALSQESMQSSIRTVFGTPVPDGSRLGPLSPHGDGGHHHSATLPGKDGPESSAEDLVCDECQWKPRGVRENLKGYLRKHKNTHKGVRLACDVPGCLKTFSRLDNLKKHKKDKHGIEDTGGTIPAKRDFVESIEEEAEPKRPSTVESDLRGATEDYSMLWPALHF